MEYKENRYGERLRFDGFRVFEDDEDWLFINIGPRSLLNIMNKAFEVSCKEAEIIEREGKKMRGTESFRILNEINRRKYIKDAADQLARYYAIGSRKD